MKAKKNGFFWILIALLFLQPHLALSCNTRHLYNYSGHDWRFIALSVNNSNIYIKSINPISGKFVTASSISEADAAKYDFNNPDPKIAAAEFRRLILERGTTLPAAEYEVQYTSHRGYINGYVFLVPISAPAQTENAYCGYVYSNKAAVNVCPAVISHAKTQCPIRGRWLTLDDPAHGDIKFIK